LRWNLLETRGGQALVEAVMQNDTILFLELSGNNISEHLLDKLEQMTGQNRIKNPISKSQILTSLDAKAY